MKTKNLKNTLNQHVLEIILVVTIVVMTFVSPSFLTAGNLLNILRNMSLQGVIAFGMTMTIICGEIDLSIGSTVALSGVIIGLVTQKLHTEFGLPMGVGVLLGMLVSVMVAAAIGLFNGYIRVKYQLPTFIITLAMMNVIYGVAALLSKGFPVTTFPAWYNFIGGGKIAGIPFPAVILLLVFGIVGITLGYTKFGRSVYSVGGNAESSRLSGINVNKVQIICMVVVQVCAALSGILMSSQVMSGSFNFGKGWEMTAISSVIIGGASLNGGVGKAWNTFLGLIFLGVIINAMTLLNIQEYTQYIVRGVLILSAVLINEIQTNRKNK